MDDEALFIPQHVPLFPLPEVVLFPRTILPLHIFEPRYRKMIADALDGDRTVAVALLKPGYEPLYYTRRAPIHATIGVGRIVESEQLADGNYNLLLRGVARATIVEESRDQDYRVARVEPVETFCSHDAGQATKLRRELYAAIRGNRGLDPDLRRHWLRLARADVELDALSDLIAAGVPIEAEVRQCLLDEPDAFARATMLVEQMRTLAAIARTYWRSMRPSGNNMN
jgi:Lon protease-like protein